MKPYAHFTSFKFVTSKINWNYIFEGNLSSVRVWPSAKDSSQNPTGEVYTKRNEDLNEGYVVGGKKSLNTQIKIA